MTDQAIGAHESMIPERVVDDSVHAEHRSETPLTFLGLLLLLIVPLGIIFHPAWLAQLAVAGTVVAGTLIVRLTFQPKA